MSLSTIVVCVLVLGILSLLSPQVRKLLAAGFTFFNAKVAETTTAVQNVDPLAVLKMEIDNAVEAGKNGVKAVSLAAKSVESLKRQLDTETTEKARLESRIKRALDNGDPNKTANGYALQLSKVEAEIKTNSEQLANAEETYNYNLKMVERYEQQVIEARRKVESLGMQLVQSESEKELRALSTGLKELNTNKFSESMQRVQDKIDLNRGESKATRDLAKTTLAEIADEELEREEEAKEILARFTK